MSPKYPKWMTSTLPSQCIPDEEYAKEWDMLIEALKDPDPDLWQEILRCFKWEMKSKGLWNWKNAGKKKN